MGGRLSDWDLHTGQRRSFRDIQPDFLAGGLALWPDGARLSVVSNSICTTFDIETLSSQTAFHVLPVTSTARRRIELSPDGRFLTMSDFNGTLRLRKPETGQILRELQSGRDAAWMDMAFSPDSSRVASCPNGSHGQVMVWQTTGGLPLGTFPTDGVSQSIAFHPRGEQLAYGTGNRVRQVSLATLKQTATYSGWDSANVDYVAFSPDGSLIAGSNHSGLILVHETDSQRQVHRFTLGPRGSHDSGDLDFTPDGRHILKTNANGTVMIFRLVEWSPDLITAVPRLSVTANKLVPPTSEAGSSGNVDDAASFVPDIPEPPPLDEWLKGRTAVTVALDGSGDFRSVVVALNAVGPGQYVRILDRGPYREQLEFGGRLIAADIGLVGDRSVIELPEWTLGVNESIGHSLRPEGGLRLSGIEFRFPQAPESDRQAPVLGLSVFNAPETVVEDCAFVFPLPREREDSKVDYRHEALKLTGDGNEPDFTPQLFVRNSQFHNGMVNVGMYRRPERPRVSIRHCWFLGRRSVPLQLTVSSLSESYITENVFDTSPTAWIGLMGSPSDPDTGDRMVFSHNTVLGGFLNISGASLKSATLQNNLHKYAAASDGSVQFVRRAEETWQIGGNGIFTQVENLRALHLRPTSRDVVHPADFLSTNPDDRDYARIPDSSPFARAGGSESGSPWAGALPPGPAPEDGDWFTRLRNRWEDDDE